MSQKIDLHIQTFKDIVDGLYDSMSEKAKDKMYLQHNKNMEARKEFILKASNKSFKESNKSILDNSVLLKKKRQIRKPRQCQKNDKMYESNISKHDLVKFEIIMMLLKTEYSNLIHNPTSEELGYIVGVDGARINQIIEASMKKIRNPTVLSQLNANNGLETINEYKILNRRIR